MKQKTKIVATISDLNCEPEFIRELYKAGMNVVRLNTAHQSPAETLKIVNNVRKVSDKIALMLDTKGPEIRTVASDLSIELKQNDIIQIGGDPLGITTEKLVYVNFAGFTSSLNEGSRILIDDGAIELMVEVKENDLLLCRAMNNGIIKGKKSVNVPCAHFNLPSISIRDKEYIEFAAKHHLDFIAHSFVRNKEDLLEIQKILDSFNSNVKLISKIENQEGVDNIDEILQHSYGIMVARGDLAIEIPYEKIPGIQKMLINKCIQTRKPVIIATQMLHSMIHEPRPTRAEVSDIANAIYSKTDAIMLSGETAFGKYPVEAVKTMSRVANEVEKSRSDFHNTLAVVLSTTISAHLTRYAVEASISLNAKAIIADTSSGRTIRNLAGYRGRKVIYAMCYEPETVRLLALSFGVHAQHAEESENGTQFMYKALQKLVRKGKLKPEDTIVILGGNFDRAHGASHLEISTVENLCRRNNSIKICNEQIDQ